MASTMTPLCGFGMGEGSDSGPVVQSRHMQVAAPMEASTVIVDEVESDWILMLTPATNLQTITVSLPINNSTLQVGRIMSMLDIANIVFIGGIVLNAPMEVLANQAVSLQCIDRQNNTWITI